MTRLLTYTGLFLTCVPAAHAQRTQTYDVVIPPEMSIQALDGPQSQAHTLDPGNLNFLESRWTLNSNLPAGASVTFTAAPFQNQSDPSSRRDVQLRLQNLESTTGARWRYTDRADRSRFAGGASGAVVSLASSGAGSAAVRVRVRFITGASPATRLSAGRYVTTLVGTITAN